MDTYEKKYKEALEKAQKINNEHKAQPFDVMLKVFPELKESEDERIRKKIIATIHLYYGEPLEDEAKEMIDWLEKQDEQNSNKWEPQTGDTFRKKGTTSPTYHLCGKREDGITFGFVENREVGISGGEITIFALKQDYELVERPKSVEDVVEEELNRALQIKIEQKPVEEYNITGISSKHADGKLGEMIENMESANKVEPKDYRSIDPHFFKTADKVEPKFKIGDIIRFKGNETLKGETEIHKIVRYDNELYVFADGTTDLFCEQDLYELVEQNPAWSEEDERLCQCIIEDQEEALDKVRNDKYGHSEIISDLKEMYHERINFLKSLKDRYTWKPSEEQMITLRQVISSCSYDIEPLVEMEEQLNKLMEK